MIKSIGCVLLGLMAFGTLGIAVLTIALQFVGVLIPWHIWFIVVGLCFITGYMVVDGIRWLTDLEVT